MGRRSVRRVVSPHERRAGEMEREREREHWSMGQRAETRVTGPRPGASVTVLALGGLMKTDRRNFR